MAKRIKWFNEQKQTNLDGTIRRHECSGSEELRQISMAIFLKGWGLCMRVRTYKHSIIRAWSSAFASTLQLHLTEWSVTLSTGWIIQ